MSTSSDMTDDDIIITSYRTRFVGDTHYIDGELMMVKECWPSMYEVDEVLGIMVPSLTQKYIILLRKPTAEELIVAEIHSE